MPDFRGMRHKVSGGYQIFGVRGARYQVGARFSGYAAQGIRWVPDLRGMRHKVSGGSQISGVP